MGGEETVSEDRIGEEKRGEKKRNREETLSVTLHCRETRRQYDSARIILYAMSSRCLVGCWLRGSGGAELSRVRVWCSGACVYASSEMGMWRSGKIGVVCGGKKEAMQEL